MFTLNSKTNSVLFSTIGVLFLTLVVNATTTSPTGVDVALAESEEEKSTSSEYDNEKNIDDDEESTRYKEDEDEDKTSSPSTQIYTNASEKTVVPIMNQSTSSTTLKTKETSETSTSPEIPENVQNEEELSTVFIHTEESDLSVTFVEGYDRVVMQDGDIVTVEKKEKLLFLFPVNISSQVILDEAGNVIDEKKTIFSWLLSALSF